MTLVAAGGASVNAALMKLIDRRNNGKGNENIVRTKKRPSSKEISNLGKSMRSCNQNKLPGWKLDQSVDTIPGIVRGPRQGKRGMWVALAAEMRGRASS